MTTATLQVVHADPTTLPVGLQPIQICPRLGDGQQVIVYNNDLTNIAYVGYRTAGLAISNTVPVQPLGSATLDASRVMYAFCPTATVQLTVAPLGTNIQPSPAQVAQQIQALGLATLTAQNTQIGQLTSAINNQATQIGQLTTNVAHTIGQEVAAQIATGSASGTPGGSPLLHGQNLLMNFVGANSFTLGPSASTFPFTVLTRPGYAIGIMATTPAGTAIPFVQVQMIWKNSTTGVGVADEFWFIPAVTSGAGTYWHYGKGPTKGDNLSIGITNLDTVQTMTIQLIFIENTQYIARDDWRGMGGGSVNYNQGSAPGGTLTTLSLISDRETINNGVDKVYLMPLYAGEVVLQFATSAMNMIVNVGIPVQLPGFSNPVIWQDATTSDVTVYMVLPRAPCYIEFHNTSGVNLGITCLMCAHENCT